jgi:outer membrane protein assembly factor BamB
MCCSSIAHAENWPSWRGSQGDGIAHESNLPTTWDKSTNVKWRVDLPGPGNASPIVWGDKVFVAQAVTEGNRRTLMCFDAKSGELLWQVGTTFDGDEPTHQTNPYCAGTPATDGKLVYVCFGTPGVYAYDFSGKEVWHRELGSLTHMFGSAVSTVLHDNLCIVNFGPTDSTKLVALDKATGDVVWEATPPALDPAETQSGRPGGRGGFGPGMMIAPSLMTQADKDDDNKISKDEFTTLAKSWFEKLDADKAGKVTQEQFVAAFDTIMPRGDAGGGGGQGRGPGGGGPGPGGPGGAGRGFGGPGGGFNPGQFVGPGLFGVLDSDKDGSLTESELTTTMASWADQWSKDKNGFVGEDQLRDGLTAALPQPNFGGGPGGGFGGPGGGGPGGRGPGGGAAGGPGGGGRGPGGGFGGGGGRGFGGGGGASWSTPIVIKSGDRHELIVGFPGRLVSYDPATGKQNWISKGIGTTIYTTPLYGEGLLIAGSSGMGDKNAIAVKTGGTGDVTESHRAWQIEGTTNQMGSGVIHDGHIYTISQDGVASCFDLKSGDEVWEKRLRGSGSQGGAWSSMLLAGDHIYVPNQSGDVFVLKASPTYELVSTNSVDESTNASLAVSNGSMFMRTDKSLWCFTAK